MIVRVLILQKERACARGQTGQEQGKNERLHFFLQRDSSVDPPRIERDVRTFDLICTAERWPKNKESCGRGWRSFGSRWMLE